MQIMNSRRTSRRSLLRRRLTIVASVVLLVLAWVAYQPAMNRYRTWKQGRSLTQARQFLDKKDLPNAKLALDVAIATSRGNPDVLRVAADLIELSGSPDSLALRREVVFLSPDSTADRLAMANTALRLRDFNSARDALAGVKPADLSQPAVLRAHLGYALAVNNRPLADALFDRLASVTAPDDEMKAMHALLLRQHPNPEKAAAARKDLEALAANPKLKLAVNRALLAEAMGTRDLPTAKRYARLVTEDPAATLNDRLNEANLLLLVDKEPFERVFAELAPVAAKSGPTAVEFIRWLLVQGKQSEAERWLGTLPPEIATSPAITRVRADLAASAKDWERLSRLLEDGAWGPIAPEVVRLAFSANVLSSRNPGLRKQVWDETLTAAGGSVSALQVLLRLVNVWRWEDELEALLWVILRVDPSQTWAHGALMNAFQQRGDGKKMLDVITILKNSAPSSATYRHDWSLLMLLVSPSKSWDSPKDLAKATHLSDPLNPNYATTYALALAQAGKAEEARSVVEKLPLAELDEPRRAPYLVFIYGQCRRPAEVEKYAARAATARLLQQEQALVSLGKEALHRPVSVPMPEPKRKASADPKPPVAK